LIQFYNAACKLAAPGPSRCVEAAFMRGSDVPRREILGTAAELLADLTAVPEPEVGASRWVTYQLLRWELEGSYPLGHMKAHTRDR
jgi:hypothetical protein